jgi:hypothetical protein
MAINVYWASTEKEWMLANEPEAISSVFYKKDLTDPNNEYSMVNYCPSFNSNLKNLYALRSLYDYSFYIDEVTKTIRSDDLNQEFFDDHVLTRSYEKKFFSFRNAYCFFTDAPSLLTTFYEYPYLEDNNITQRCIPVAGQFDIGKYFRGTEFAFYIKKDYNSFKIERGEIYSYIRFHTTEQINFIQFRFTDKLRQMDKERFAAIALNLKLKSLEKYYNMFRHKKLILKEIKENII